jgi:hypothetical protein
MKKIGEQLIFGNTYDVIEQDDHTHWCRNCYLTDMPEECNATKCGHGLTIHESGQCVIFRKNKNIDKSKFTTRNYIPIIPIKEDVTKPDVSITVTDLGERVLDEVDSESYYRGICHRIGALLGIDAYTSDDGSIQCDPLSTKLPELVAKLIYQKTVLESKVNQLEVMKRLGL